MAGASLKADQDWLKSNIPVLVAPAEFVVNTAFLTLPLCTIASALTGVRKKNKAIDGIERTVKSLLNDFRGSAFPEDDPEVDHQITLFRHQKWGWRRFNIFKGQMPWHGWLVPFARSGEFGQISKTRFYAPMHNPDKIEGFAGKIFRNKNCEYILGLPDLNSSNTGKKNKAKYARATNVSLSWVEKRIESKQRFARSFWGVHIEVDGKIWGVLLIDSKASNLKGKNELKSEFRQTGLALSTLLSGVS